MGAERNPLLLIAYAPALVSGDSRALAVVHGMERGLPGLRLTWTISDEGHFVALPQRDAWLEQERTDGGFPLLCNGDESSLVTIFGWETSVHFSARGQPLLDVHANLPLDKAVLSAAPAVLEEVAAGARAFWAHATPKSAAGDIAQQTSPTSGGPPRPPRGLPALKLPQHLRSPEVPHRLGWMNYWSAAAAQVIGFPDPERDADLLSRSRRTAAGGWIVQLTEAPLDLDKPAHLDALLRAYQRFPEIGGRSDT